MQKDQSTQGRLTFLANSKIVSSCLAVVKGEYTGKRWSADGAEVCFR